VIKEEGFNVQDMYNIVEDHFSISIATMRSQGGSLEGNKLLNSFIICHFGEVRASLLPSGRKQKWCILFCIGLFVPYGVGIEHKNSTSAFLLWML
jgi:hypothetical protein